MRRNLDDPLAAGRLRGDAPTTAHASARTGRLRTMTAPVTIAGTYDPAFKTVYDTFAEHFVRHPTTGLPELGAAVCVEVDGRRVVDLWAGWADVARTRPWTADTLACVCSCTKGMTAIA